MDKTEAKQILDKIILRVFGVNNPLTLEQCVKKFTFDVRLPQKVKDATDGSVTWAASTNPTKFITMENARNNGNEFDGLYASEPIKDLKELLSKWEHVNLTTAELAHDSLNVAESDLTMRSENVFQSINTTDSKNVLYSDSVFDSEFVFASQRSGKVTFCIRADDSIRCADSFAVSRCIDLTNCFMMHDCGDMQDSMFCSNMNGKQFCIANMQFEEAEYKRLRKEVIDWILSPA